MPQIKLTEKGFETYTGQIGDADFENGVSVEVLSKADAARIGSAMRTVDVETNHAIGVGQHLLDTKGKSAPVSEAKDAFHNARSDKYIKQSGETDVVNRQGPAAKTEAESDADPFDIDPGITGEKTDTEPGAESTEPEVTPEPAPEVTPEPIVTATKFPYTRESLEEIADKGGILPLREEAIKHGVQGSSVKSIIDDLMAKKDNE